MKKVADAVEGARGGEIGEAARTLRDACLTQSSGQIQTRHLVELWRDLWPLEKDLIQKTLAQREEWIAGGFDEAEATLWHDQAAQRAFESMQKELIDTKERSLKFSPSAALEDACLQPLHRPHSGRRSGGSPARSMDVDAHVGCRICGYR